MLTTSVPKCVHIPAHAYRPRVCLSVRSQGRSSGWLSRGSVVKNPPANVGDVGSIPGSRRSPEKSLATHSSIFAWETPWAEEPGGLQSMGLQKSQT